MPVPAPHGCTSTAKEEEKGEEVDTGDDGGGRGARLDFLAPPVVSGIIAPRMLIGEAGARLRERGGWRGACSATRLSPRGAGRGGEALRDRGGSKAEPSLDGTFQRLISRRLYITTLHSASRLSIP